MRIAPVDAEMGLIVVKSGGPGTGGFIGQLDVSYSGLGASALLAGASLEQQDCRIETDMVVLPGNLETGIIIFETGNLVTGA